MLDIDLLKKQTTNLTLLYVEDEQMTRENTILLLQEIFENIIVAVDGEDGLNKFKDNKIDLIITDINMPNLNGLDMIKYIKKIDNQIPIIVFTAIMDLSAIKTAIDIGIDAFINKPLSDIDLLFNKIDILLKKILFDRNEKEKERMKLIAKMLHTISHHWKQPLSIISVISSTLEFKIDNNILLTHKDFQQIKTITMQTQELSDILGKIDKIDLENMGENDFKDIIEISNTLYEESK